MPPPYPRGPGAAAVRDKTTLRLLRWWLEQPFEYEWVHAFAESRAWLRIDRMLVASGYIVFAGLGITLLATGRPGTVASVCGGIGVVVFVVSAWWWWSDRPWPVERTSLGFVVIGELAGLPLAAAAPTSTAALALLSLYVLPGIYLMFIHGPGILIAHCIWVSAVVAGTGSYALLATDIDVATAVVLMVSQLVACNGGLVAGQIALTFLRNDARKSFTDPLTGLLNRRGFEEAVAHSVIRYRPGDPVSIVMADIDKFKTINDVHGHRHGDGLLVDVARALESVCAGHADAIARIGGDEFVTMMHVDSEVAATLAHRVRAAMSDASRASQVTMSFGVHTTVPETWPPSDVEVGDMLARADAVLYATKRGGGDAVTAGHGHTR